MKSICVLLGCLVLLGCAGVHRNGVSRYDVYDSVTVDQMVGNNVSQIILSKTVVCLNARREARRITVLTNVTVTAITNQTVNAITNQTISTSSNFLFTVITNLSPVLAPLTLQPVGDSAAGSETNVAAVAAAAAAAIATNVAPALTTNVTVSVANNVSGTVAPAQRTANNQLMRTLNNQLTSTSNNLSVALMTNLVVSAETNQVVSYVTNTAVVSFTNIIVSPTNAVAYDYFLYTELIPPQDFTLQPGESLVLLVDGVRYGFAQGQSGTAFVGRRGFTSGLYRVPPEVLVAIANAKEVNVRFKGVNNVFERTMSQSSKQHFRDFLVKYFTPETLPAGSNDKAASLEESTRIANR